MHMGLDKALSSYPEHVNILRDIEEFWSRNENREFELAKPHIFVKTVSLHYILKKILFRINATVTLTQNDRLKLTLTLLGPICMPQKLKF